MNEKYGFQGMDEILARLTTESRQEEALRYAALCLGSAARRPIRVAVAVTLRDLADRFEPALERTELVRQ